MLEHDELFPGLGPTGVRLVELAALLGGALATALAAYGWLRSRL